MKGLILAGGKGTRLRPLTINTPKPVVPVANAPFLLYQIDLMRSGGIEEIILSLSYQPRKIEDLLKDGSDYGVWIRYAVEGTPLGTGGAFKNAEEQIDSTTVVFNGDVLTSIDLSAVVARHREKRAIATLVLTPVENPSAYGLVETSPEGWVQRFVEKPGPDEITCNTINAGIYILEPSVLNYMPKGEPYSFERGLFPTLLEHKEPVLSFVMDSYWIDIGTPRKYLEVHQDILAKKFASPRVSPNALDRPSLPAGATVDEKSIIDQGVTIRSGVRIENSVIGRNCKIDEGAQIIDSVVWSGNTIDADARVNGSIVGKGCYIGRSATLRDGVVLGDKTVVTDFSQL
ncbi:MAG TPA: NDP-sugar synthase [Terriglobia bacterium]|nr:NDP-sugar synthase [Terriglobia bacterium]